MADEDKLFKMKYVGNSDRFNRTGAITLAGRDSVAMDESGEFTQAEVNMLTSAGIMLEPVSDDDDDAVVPESSSHTHDDVEHEHVTDFDSLTVAELDDLIESHPDIATVQGSGVGGSVLKEDRVNALKAAH